MGGQTATYDRSMFQETFEREFTYLNGFRRNVLRFGGRVALACPLRRQEWTYRELDELTNRLGHALQRDGVRPRDVVVFQLLNGIEFASLYIACQKIGAIGCPINYRLAPGETASILDDSRPVVFFYDADVERTALSALDTARHRPGRSMRVDAPGPSAPEAAPFAAYLDGQPGTPPAAPPERSIYDETTRLYTSGTTGMPKGVPINSLIEVLSAHDVIMHFPLSPLDRTLNMSPWFHRGGLYSGGPNPAFYAGAAVVPMRQFDPDLALDLVVRYRLSYLIGAPTNLRLLTDAQALRPRDLSSLKGIVTMGAPLERQACMRYQQVLTPNIFNGYGTTEAFWNTFLRPFDLPEMAGSAGRSCTDDDVAVVSLHEDRRAEPHELARQDGREVGEVIVRAPGKCAYTYIGRPEESARTFHAGWVYIGDLGTWDADGFVTIVGRKDDMIISGGENVHPVQVEEALNAHPGVLESAVVGVADPTWGQRVAAYVVRRDPGVTAGDLDRHCQGHPLLARFKRPRLYRFVESLPFTATGKKMHYRVRAMAEEDLALGRFETV